MYAINIKRVVAILMLAMLLISGLSFTSTAYAVGLEDDMSVTEESYDYDEEANFLNPPDSNEPDNGIGDMFKSHQAVTKEQLATSERTMSPITNFVGYVIGAIITLLCTGIFLMTAIDLIYIAIPPVRNLLYSGGQQGGGMMGSPMGMGMGGPRMGMGMGMGGAPQGGAKAHQWISDEAVKCAALIGAAGQQAGGMGMMGGPGMMGGQQQNMSKKSVIGYYLKQRIVFMVLFAVCVVVLMSSVFLGTGINLAQWGINMVHMLNGAIPV